MAKTATKVSKKAAGPDGRSSRSERSARHRGVSDAPETNGFNKTNMPAFLARPVRSA